MRDYHKLDVWAKGHSLNLVVYQVTQTFPRREIFGLAAQMRKAATSIPANVVEGCARSSRKDFARFLDMSAGSSSELAYYVELARDLEYLSHDVAAGLASRVAEVARMTVALRKTVLRTA